MPIAAWVFRPRSEKLVRGGGTETADSETIAPMDGGAAIAGKTHRQTLARHRQSAPKKKQHELILK
jgi:hypothetical protein